MSNGLEGGSDSSALQNAISNVVEKFDYVGVAGVLSELNGVFAEFASTLESAAPLIATYLETGLISPGGEHLLDLWNTNYLTFGDFYKNFDKWSEMVIGISKLEGGFESETAALFAEHQTEALSLSGVNDARINAALAMGSVTLAGAEFGTAVLDDKGQSTGTYKVTLEDGTVIEYVKDENGNLHTYVSKKGDTEVRKTFSEFGTIVTTTSIVGASVVETTVKNGVVTETVVRSEDGKTIFRREVLEVDSDGNASYKIYKGDKEAHAIVEVSSSDTPQLSGDLAKAQQFVEQYGKANGTTGWLRAFESLTPEQQALVTREFNIVDINNENAATLFLEQNGVTNDSTTWQQAYDGLTPEQQAIVDNKLWQADRLETLTSESKYTVSVPTSDYLDTLPDNEETRLTETQKIIDSANTVNESISGEATTLTNLKETLVNDASFSALPEVERTEILNYIDNEITARVTLSDTIEAGVAYGAGVTDGKVGNQMTWNHEGWHKSALTVTAIPEVQKWNESLSQLTTMDGIGDKLSDMGIEVTNGGVFVNDK